VSHEFGILVLEVPLFLYGVDKPMQTAVMKTKPFLDRIRDDARKGGRDGRGGQETPSHAPDQHGGNRHRDETVPEASRPRSKRERGYGRILGQGGGKGRAEGHHAWRHLMHRDRACSDCHQRRRDLRGCNPRPGVGFQGLFETFAENSIVPLPPDPPERLVQTLLKLWGRRDGIRQGIPERHAIPLP
jgi:hypothetical protein